MLLVVTISLLSVFKRQCTGVANNSISSFSSPLDADSPFYLTDIGDCFPEGKPREERSSHLTSK